jgi:hypothetical protein
MKIPKWNGSGSPSNHLFSLVCFFVGFAAVTALSVGRIKYDDRQDAGWSPVSRLPDGKVGLSEFAISAIGFVLIGAVLTAMAGMSFKTPSAQSPPAEFTIKSR